MIVAGFLVLCFIGNEPCDGRHEIRLPKPFESFDACEEWLKKNIETLAQAPGVKFAYRCESET